MRILRLGAPGLLVLVIALALTGELTARAAQGWPSPPFLTLLIVPLTRALMFVSGAIAVGGALVGGVLGSRDDVRRMGRTAALVFAGASAVVAVADLADLLSVEWWDALRPTMLFSFVTQIDEGRYLLLQVAFAFTAALLLTRSRDRFNAALALTALLVAVALPGFTGHSTAALSHWIASTTMIAHLLAMNLWVGGVIGLMRAPDLHARFRPLALACYLMLLASGIGNLLARIGSWDAFWHDPYLAVLAAKVLVFLAIGVMVTLRRSRTDEDAESASKGVRRVLVQEGTLMLVAIAFAVTLARMPNP